MAFRYMNPGYGELLAESGAETLKNYIYNPYNEVSFTASNKMLTIVPAGKISTDFYCKFDVYFPSSDSTSFYIGMARYDNLDSAMWLSGIRINNGVALFYFGSNKIGTEIQLKPNAINTINFAIHINNATCEFSVNNSEKVTGNIVYYKQYYDERSPIRIYFPTSSSSNIFYVSNMIISDEEISPKEKIIALPIGTTATDMTAGASGIYLADAVNQTLLQSADVSALVENYGETSKVTGIALVGNPAYKTGTVITTLTGLSKLGGVVTEHGTCELSENTTAVIMDGWGMSGVTIADLQGMQFGWKAGE